MFKPFVIVRQIFSVIVLFIWTAIIAVPYLLHVLFLGYESAGNFGWPKIWGKFFCFVVGAKVHVRGIENVPKKGVVFLFSHSSFLDIPVLLSATPGVLNFAAKSFVFKIPVMGQVMRVIKTIEIPSDREKAIAQYKIAEDRLRDGDRFMVAPEGSRSCGETIDPFKSGPFIFAMNCNATLVPVTSYGASLIWPREDLLPNSKQQMGTIYVDFLPSISLESWTDENRKIKANEIREDMLEVLEKQKKA